MAGQTPAEYISHHIQNLTYGVKNSGELGFAESAAEAKNMGFMALNVDTMFWSVSCGILFVGSSDGLLEKSQFLRRARPNCS